MNGSELHVEIERFELFGELSVSNSLGFGEHALDVTVPIHPGRWRVFYLDEDVIDTLVDEGQLPYDAAQQLVLIHADHEPPSTRRLDGLRQAGLVPIEGASLVIADTPRWADLTGSDNFYQYLDGVHGIIDGGWGLQIALEGDGQAAIWAPHTEPCGLIFVEMV